MSEIKFACPHCRQHIACDDAYFGEKINCPGCERELFVPRRSAFVPMQAGNLTLELPVASKIQPYSPPTAPSGLLTDEEWGALAAGKQALAASNNQEINWLVFFAVLLAPAVLTMLGMATGAFQLVMFATFIGSGWAGITCARMLARRFGWGAPLTTVLSLVFGALSFILCFVGCVAGIPFAAQLKGH